MHQVQIHLKMRNKRRHRREKVAVAEELLMTNSKGRNQERDKGQMHNTVQIQTWAKSLMEHHQSQEKIRSKT